MLKNLKNNDLQVSFNQTVDIVSVSLQTLLLQKSLFLLNVVSTIKFDAVKNQKPSQRDVKTNSLIQFTIVNSKHQHADYHHFMAIIRGNLHPQLRT